MESIAAGTARIITGLTKALQESGRAGETVQSIAAHSARTGFTGIAQSMTGVHQLIERIGAGIQATSVLANDAVAAAAAVPSEATPQDTLAALSALDMSLTTVHDNLGTILSDISRARQAAITVLQGGRPAVMLAALDAVKTTLTTIVGIVNRARQEVRSAVAEVTRLGDEVGDRAGGPSSGGSGPPAEFASDDLARTQPMLSVTEGWTAVDAKDAPVHVREAAKYFKPRFDKVPRETVVVYDGDQHVSGGRRQYRGLADDLDRERILRPDGRPYPRVPDLFVVHPEMRVAADMRKMQLTDAEIVVDNTMCGSRGFDRNDEVTCEKYLPGAMPANSRMTVWATVDGGRTFYRKTITGTGRLIRR